MRFFKSKTERKSEAKQKVGLDWTGLNEWLSSKQQPEEVRVVSATQKPTALQDGGQNDQRQETTPKNAMEASALASELGLLGEPAAKQKAKLIIVKDHLLHKMARPQYQSAILLVRNPYHAVLAEWSRLRTGSHTGLPTPKAFTTIEFQKFGNTSAVNWLTHLKLTLKHKWEVLLIYYENLRRNPLREMRRVAHFLQLNSTDHQKYFERRLMCMQMNLAGHFKRPPRNLDFDPFKEPSLRQRFDDSIKKANRTLMKFQLPPLPSSYL